MKSEAISIDRYAGGQPAKQFDFIYENFSVIQEMIRDFREDIIQEVIDQKTYNRRSSNGDLGVRVQISMGISNSTQNQAINHWNIEEAIDKGILDEDFFEDTDNKHELIRKIDCYHAIHRDVDIFRSKLVSMDPRDQKILKPYLLRQKTMDDLTEDMGIDYRSAIKRVYRIKKKLIEKVEPRLTGVNREGV